MAEYIERDEAVRKAISACIKIVGHGITQIDAGDIAYEIDSIPTADVVEVVRCKECNLSAYPEAKIVWCRRHNKYMPVNGYCNYGARKGDV